MNWSEQALLRAACFSLLVLAIPLRAAVVTGEIVDARGGQLIPARLYVQADDGRWFFATSASPSGSAIRSSAVLSPEAVAEYRKALSVYEDIARRAR